jgi:hypothetical protein
VTFDELTRTLWLKSPDDQVCGQRLADDLGRIDRRAVVPDPVRNNGRGVVASALVNIRPVAKVIM